MNDITRTYRVELLPTREQDEQLRQIAGAVKFTYNAALDQRVWLWRDKRERISAFDQMKQMTEALQAPELDFLRQAPRMALNGAVQNLDRGMQAFFRRVKRGETPGFPRHKGRGSVPAWKFFSSVTISTERPKIEAPPVEIEPATTARQKIRRRINPPKLVVSGRALRRAKKRARSKPARERRDYIHLPKVGRVALREHGYLPIGRLKIASGSVRMQAGRWFATVTLADDDPGMRVIEARKAEPSGTMAIHAGLRCYAVVMHRHDDGTVETLRLGEWPRAYQRALGRLRRAQRSLSRRKKGSRGREVQRLEVATTHKRVADIRSRFLHDLTGRLLYDHRPARVIVEDWHIPDMTDRHFNRQIYDAAWGEFKRMLTYKAGWLGCEVVEVPEGYPSSKRCSECGHVKGKFPLSAKTFRCDECGATRDRERNAVENLMRYVSVM